MRTLKPVMGKLLLPVLMLVFLLGTVEAQVYYVSTAGDDDSTGTTEETAFRTIAKANQLVEAGDQVMILPGTYEDAISPLASGNEAEGFISYTGLGALPDEVVISHPGDAWVAGVQLEHQSYIRVENISIANNSKFGIWINSGQDHPLSHVEVLNCIIVGNGYRNPGWGRTGIRTKYVDDLLIQDCHIRDNHGGGMLIQDAYGVIIDRCQVLGNRAGRPFSYSADDFDGICIQSCSDVLIRNVEAAYNGEDGIDIGLHEEAEHIKDNSNVYIESCISHHNAKKGICVSNSNVPEEGWKIYDVTITRCLSFYNGKAGIEMYQNSTDLRLSHNTVFSQSFGNDDNDSQYDCGINIEADGVDRVFLRNNISAFNESLNFSAKKALSGATVIGHNNLWQHSLNNTQNYTSVDDRVGDPLFMDKGSITNYPDLNLKENSPAVDRGTFLALTTNAGTASTAIELDDARWFTDGLGVLEGSTVRIGEQIAIVSEVVDGYNIVMDRAVTWSIGDGLSYDYQGTAPDIGAIENGEMDLYLETLSIIPSLPAGYDPDTWPQSAPDPDVGDMEPDPNADAGTSPANKGFEAGLRFYNNSSCELSLVKKKDENSVNVHGGDFALRVSNRTHSTGSPKQDDGLSTNMKEYFHATNADLYRAGVWVKPTAAAEGIRAGVSFELKRLNESLEEEKFWSSYRYTALSEAEWTECWGLYSIPDDEGVSFVKIWTETLGDEENLIDYFIDDYSLRPAVDQDVVDLIARDISYELSRINENLDLSRVSGNISLPLSAENFRCAQAGAILSWSSSSPDVFSNNGLVNFVPGQAVSLKLTLSIEFGSSSGFVDLEIIVSDPVLSDQYRQSAGLRLYPNPAKDCFYVSGLEASGSMILVDMGGRIVKKFDRVREGQVINTEALTRGLYLVRIISLGGIEQQVLNIL